MKFTFVHTADWQIGKVFGNLPADKAPLLREARLSAIGRIAALARSCGADHVLVAGDVYDARDIPDRDLAQSLDRMRREQHVTWHLLPGNHDAAHPGGIWERVVRAGVPANVSLHLEPGPVAIAPDIVLLPAPLKARSVIGDPTAWMDTADTPATAYRIGLAHGSIQGFGSEDGEAAVPLAPDRAARAHLNYLALGDWHGAIRISDRVWYSGTPEPDRFPDNEPGFALVVQLDGLDRPPTVERHATGQFRWLKRSLDVTAPTSLDHFIDVLMAGGTNPEHVLLSLTVTGTPSLGHWTRTEERLEALGQQLCHLVVDSGAVTALPEAAELEDFGQGDLRHVAERLTAIAQDGANHQSDDASLALRKLYAMVRDLRVRESS